MSKIIIKSEQVVLVGGGTIKMIEDCILYCDYEENGTANLSVYAVTEKVSSLKELVNYMHEFLSKEPIPIITIEKSKLRDDVPIRQNIKFEGISKPVTMFMFQNRVAIAATISKNDAGLIESWYTDDTPLLDYYFQPLDEEEKDRLSRIERSKTPHFINWLQYQTINILGHQRPANHY